MCIYVYKDPWINIHVNECNPQWACLQISGAGSNGERLSNDLTIYIYIYAQKWGIV